jgi:hypothetical protein
VNGSIKSPDGAVRARSGFAQRRLDEHPEKMRQRRETVEHPFGTIKARIGATHFLVKTLSHVASEMTLHVLAYNLARVMNIIGIRPLLAAIGAWFVDHAIKQDSHLKVIIQVI